MVTIGSAMVSGFAQMQQSQARSEAIEQSQERKQEQLEAQAADKSIERARAANREQARLRTLAGESGVAGASVDAQLQESKFNEGRDIASIQSNAGRRIQSSRATANAKKAQLPSGSQTALETGLKIGTATVNDKHFQDNTGIS